MLRSQLLILIPVLMQMGLTLVILGLLPVARSRSMRQRRQNLQDMALAGKTDWNESAQKIASNFSSQFELPVLFYAISAFALITRSVDVWMIALAWTFTLSRCLHAAIHIGPNIVVWRFGAFALGLLALVGMMAQLAIAVLTTTA